MDKEEFVERICRDTGISKRDLARLVGIHHSMLIKYQAGTRTLPAEVMLKLAAMHKVLNAVLPAPAAAFTEAEITIVKERATICREKMHKLRGKYNAMLLNWQTANTALQIVADVANNMIPVSSSTPQKQQRWVEEQQYQASKQLQRNGPAAQRALHIQIAILEKEASLWEETIANQTHL